MVQMVYDNESILTYSWDRRHRNRVRVVIAKSQQSEQLACVMMMTRAEQASETAGCRADGKLD
jgi:hypothetical protein